MKLESIGGLQATLRDAQQYRMAKELLKQLGRYLPVRVTFYKWKEIDKEMAGEELEMLPEIFQRVLQYRFPWELAIMPAPTIKPREIVIDEALRKTPIWQMFGTKAKGAEAPGVVVLFRLNNNGTWVMHNTNAPTSGAFVCVPAQRTGGRNIVIEPLNRWAEREIGTNE